MNHQVEFENTSERALQLDIEKQEAIVGAHENGISEDVINCPRFPCGRCASMRGCREAGVI